MAAKKRLPATPTPRVVGPPGEPVGAFLQTLEQAKKAGLAIEPYDIMPDLVLDPPTEARSKALASASAANLLAQTAAVKLVQQPEDPPAAPRALPNQVAGELNDLANNIKRMMSKSDVPDELIEQMIVAVRNVAVTVGEVPAPDVAEYDEYLRQYERYNELRQGFPIRQQRELKACQEQAEEAQDAYTQALIGGGDTYQRVQEFFAERPDWQREAFVEAVTKRFLRLPDDGRCLACGRVDPKERNSAAISATGSSTTGTNSTPISPSTSEPTPTTGSEEPDRGSSSPTTSTG